MQGHGQPQPAAPRRQARRRERVVVLLALILVVALAWLAVPRCFPPRESAVRVVKQSWLRAVAQAADIYRSNTGSSPALDDLLAAGLIDERVREEFSRVEATGDEVLGSASLPLLVQTVPNRAVRAGEPWGGPGEKADHDIPPNRYILMPDWTVLAMDEPEFQRELSGRVRLVPF